MEIEVAANTQFVTDIADPSHAGEARRAAVECAASIGMDETDCGKIAIAVTEMATNVVKHAGHGKIICVPIGQNGTNGLRVLSLDKGPGIRDIAAALQDGYSTYGSNGNGLGSIRRLSTAFDLYSLPRVGTCIVAEFWSKKKSSVARSFSLGVVSLAMRGELVCGDGWGSGSAPGRSFFMVVDGLGHGMLAAEAAREAERVLAAAHETSPGSILRDCHDALKKTRGAAAAVAEVSQEKGTLTYAGIGNIYSTVIDGNTRRGLANHNGTLGHQMQKFQEFTAPWNKDSILIMHSDGLGSRWDLNQYPGLATKHPAIIAAVLYRDFARERDDVTVMAAKNTQ
jgi:anti-sigma regulatory factor (Ser/Thr protein kinase)